MAWTLSFLPHSLSPSLSLNNFFVVGCPRSPLFPSPIFCTHSWNVAQRRYCLSLFSSSFNCLSLSMYNLDAVFAAWICVCVYVCLYVCCCVSVSLCVYVCLLVYVCSKLMLMVVVPSETRRFIGDGHYPRVFFKKNKIKNWMDIIIKIEIKIEEYIFGFASFFSFFLFQLLFFPCSVSHPLFLFPITIGEGEGGSWKIWANEGGILDEGR